MRVGGPLWLVLLTTLASLSPLAVVATTTSASATSPQTQQPNRNEDNLRDLLQELIASASDAGVGLQISPESAGLTDASSSTRQPKALVDNKSTLLWFADVIDPSDSESRNKRKIESNINSLRDDTFDIHSLFKEALIGTPLGETGELLKIHSQSGVDPNTHPLLLLGQKKNMMNMIKQMPVEFKMKFITLLLQSDRNGLYELLRELISSHMKSISNQESVKRGKSLSKQSGNKMSSSQFVSRQGSFFELAPADVIDERLPSIKSAVILHKEIISEPGQVSSRRREKSRVRASRPKVRVSSQRQPSLSFGKSFQDQIIDENTSSRDPSLTRVRTSSRDPSSTRVRGSSRDPSSTRVRTSSRDPPSTRVRTSSRDPSSTRIRTSSRDPSSTRIRTSAQDFSPTSVRISQRGPSFIRVRTSPRESTRVRSSSRDRSVSGSSRPSSKRPAARPAKLHKQFRQTGDGKAVRVRTGSRIRQPVQTQVSSINSIPSVEQTNSVSSKELTKILERVRNTPAFNSIVSNIMELLQTEEGKTKLSSVPSLNAGKALLGSSNIGNLQSPGVPLPPTTNSLASFILGAAGAAAQTPGVPLPPPANNLPIFNSRPGAAAQTPGVALPPPANNFATFNSPPGAASQTPGVPLPPPANNFATFNPRPGAAAQTPGVPLPPPTNNFATFNSSPEGSVLQNTGVGVPLPAPDNGIASPNFGAERTALPRPGVPLPPPDNSLVILETRGQPAPASNSGSQPSGVRARLPEDFGPNELAPIDSQLNNQAQRFNIFQSAEQSDANFDVFETDFEKFIEDQPELPLRNLGSSPVFNFRPQTIVPLSTDIGGQLFDEAIVNFRDQTEGSTTSTSNFIDEDGEFTGVLNFVPLSTDIQGQLTDIPKITANPPEAVDGQVLSNTGVPLPIGQLGSGSSGDFGLALADFGTQLQASGQQSIGVPLPTNVGGQSTNSFGRPRFTIEPDDDDVPGKSLSSTQGNNIGVPLPSLTGNQNSGSASVGVPLPSSNANTGGGRLSSSPTSDLFGNPVDVSNIPTFPGPIGVPLPTATGNDGPLITRVLTTEPQTDIFGNAINIHVPDLPTVLNRPVEFLSQSAEDVDFSSLEENNFSGFGTSDFSGEVLVQSFTPGSVGIPLPGISGGTSGIGELSHISLESDEYDDLTLLRSQGRPPSMASYDAVDDIGYQKHPKGEKGKSDLREVTFLTPGLLFPFGGERGMLYKENQRPESIHETPNYKHHFKIFDENNGLSDELDYDPYPVPSLTYTVPPMGYPRYELPDVAPAPAPGYGLPAPGYALPEVAPAPVPGKCRPRTIVTTSVLAIKQPPVETTLTKLYKEVHTIKSFYVTPVTVAKTYSVLPSVLTTASYQASDEDDHDSYDVKDETSELPTVITRLEGIPLGDFSPQATYEGQPQVLTYKHSAPLLASPSLTLQEQPALITKSISIPVQPSEGPQVIHLQGVKYERRRRRSADHDDDNDLKIHQLAAIEIPLDSTPTSPFIIDQTVRIGEPVAGKGYAAPPSQLQYSLPIQQDYTPPSDYILPLEQEYSTPQQLSQKYSTPQQLSQEYSEPLQQQYSVPEQQQPEYSAPQQLSQEYAAPNQNQYAAPQISVNYETVLRTLTTLVARTVTKTQYKVSTINIGPKYSTIRSTSVYCDEPKQKYKSYEPPTQEYSASVQAHTRTPALPLGGPYRSKEHSSTALVRPTYNSKLDPQQYRTWVGTLIDDDDDYSREDDIDVPSKFILLQHMWPKGFVVEDEDKTKTQHIKLSHDVHKYGGVLNRRSSRRRSSRRRSSRTGRAAPPLKYPIYIKAIEESDER